MSECDAEEEAEAMKPLHASQSFLVDTHWSHTMEHGSCLHTLHKNRCFLQRCRSPEALVSREVLPCTLTHVLSVR